MNATKKINVNFSSLVGLKAELLRKQTEVNAAKLKSEPVYTAPKVKKNNKRPKEESTDKKLVDADDANAHKKSKLMLEAKARLYERLKKSGNSNEKFLVDFSNKSDESEDEYPTELDYQDDDIDPEDGWVEYEDCFGRTRKCLRKDLPIMREKDEFVKRQVARDNNVVVTEKSDSRRDAPVQEAEPEIEIMRRKWEQQTNKLADKADIHYQDVLFDEARTHGVGYYAFSQDEQERAKQQENLAKLRKQTEQRQKEARQLKDLRDKMEQNRLKAARIRQRIRAGLPSEATEGDEVLQNVPTVEDAGREITDVQHTSANNRADGQNRQVDTDENNSVIVQDEIKALGALLGTTAHWQEMSQEEWVYERRKDRITEFAPLYCKFKESGASNIVEERVAKPSSCEDTVDSPTSSWNRDKTFSSPVDSVLSAETHPLPRGYVEDSDVERSSDYNEADVVGDPVRVPSNFAGAAQSYPNCNSANLADDRIDSVTVCHRSFDSMPSNAINEERIAAGLKYLREKFEKAQGH